MQATASWQLAPHCRLRASRASFAAAPSAAYWAPSHEALKAAWYRPRRRRAPPRPPRLWVFRTLCGGGCTPPCTPQLGHPSRPPQPLPPALGGVSSSDARDDRTPWPSRRPRGHLCPAPRRRPRGPVRGPRRASAMPQATCKTRCRSNPMLAHPYIWRLSILSRLTWPSVWPLLQGSLIAARTAASWRSSPAAKSHSSSAAMASGLSMFLSRCHWSATGTASGAPRRALLV